MVNYAAPGVYVQEIPSGTHSIGRVGTSTLGIVGVAPDPQARKDEAVPIDNWTQFVDTYVGSATAGTALSTAVYGFFANGGGRCWVVNVGPGGDLTGTARTAHRPRPARGDRRGGDRRGSRVHRPAVV